MVSLHETEGRCGIATYLTLINRDLSGTSVLPFVYCNFTIVNHVKEPKSVQQGEHPKLPSSLIQQPTELSQSYFERARSSGWLQTAFHTVSKTARMQLLSC